MVRKRYSNTWHITPNKNYTVFEVKEESKTFIIEVYDNRTRKCKCNKDMVYIIEKVDKMEKNQLFFNSIIILLLIVVIFVITFK